MDWNMWSRQRRADAVRRAGEFGVPCHLHHLRVPMETAIDRATGRRDPESHQLTAEDIAHLRDLFEAPDPSEGFVLHEVDGMA